MADKKSDSDNDDFALFRAEMGDAEPLQYDKLLHQKEKPKPQVLHKNKRETQSDNDSFSDMFAPESVGNEEYLEYRGHGIQHKQFTKLRAGKVHIEAELDLHGMTLQLAEPTLSNFLNECQQQNIRCVRIIHGKGWGSKENKPVLKAKLNHWLRQSQNVLAFCSATVEDGGTGAVYVLLKRIYYQPDEMD